MLGVCVLIMDCVGRVVNSVHRYNMCFCVCVCVLCVCVFVCAYILRNLCVLILLHTCVLIPLYKCPHRIMVAQVENEHAVKIEVVQALLFDTVWLIAGLVRSIEI